MVIGLLRVRLRLHEAASLKEKRSVLKPLLARLRKDHNVAVAEVDDQDIWRSTVLAVVAVSAGRDPVENILRGVAKELGETPFFDLVEEQMELL